MASKNEKRPPELTIIGGYFAIAPLLVLAMVEVKLFMVFTTILQIGIGVGILRCWKIAYWGAIFFSGYSILLALLIVFSGSSSILLGVGRIIIPTAILYFLIRKKTRYEFYQSKVLSG